MVPRQGLYARWFKRGVDIAGAGVLLLLSSPMLALAALAVKVAMGGPVIFAQTRPGMGGRPFTLFKLRTMSATRAGRFDPADDGARLTRTGAWLRRLSIDELPQLWNVLRGDMSLVGPRPLLMQYLARYTPRQALRHVVRPGITGLAQVSGRNALSWEEKFELDVQYISTVSCRLDVSILVRTVRAVLDRRGISQPEHATAAEFMGSQRL